MSRTTCLLAALYIAASTAQGQDAGGASVYRQHCAACHDKGLSRAPLPDAMRQLAPETVLASLETGVMKTQGAALSAAERRAVAVFLTGKELGAVTESKVGWCANSNASFKLEGPEWNGWGAGYENTRYQERPGIRAEDVPRLKVKWAFGLPGVVAMRGAPVIAGGRVFFGGGANRMVYSLDAASGCIHWTYTAQGGVRAAMQLGKRTDGKIALYLGDGTSTVYALDAATGALIWKNKVDSQAATTITGGLKLYEGRLYVPISVPEDGLAMNPKYACCQSRGAVVALDAETGKQIWKTYSIPEVPSKRGVNSAGAEQWGPSGASVWNSPTIDNTRKRLYVGTGNNHSNPPSDTSDAVLALDLESGKLIWKRQLTPGGDAFNMGCVAPNKANCPENTGPDHDVGAGTILRTLPSGKQILLAGQKSSEVHAIDPDTGDLIWSVKLGRGGPLGGVEWGMAADREAVYAALSDIAMMNPDINTSGKRFEPNPEVGGGLFALNIADGKLRWQAKPAPCGKREGCSPAQSQAVTAIPGVVFSGSLDGHFRAYSAKDGSVIWDFDTVRNFETVNGVAAKGGAMDAAGPVIAGGLLLVNSGYGNWGGMPGNVLIAFTVDGK
jgi:polyvinyl alcohol dehydrogenase (cytochrome)